MKLAGNLVMLMLVIIMLLMASTWVSTSELDIVQSSSINVSISIHSYGQRHGEATSNLKSMLHMIRRESLLPFISISDIKVFNDSICDRSSDFEGHYHISILITPTLCQSYPRDYVLYHLHDDDFQPHMISHEDPYLFSSHIRLKETPYEHAEIGVSSDVYQRAIAVWTSTETRVNYLTQILGAAQEAVRFVPSLKSHELSVGYNLEKLSEIISWAIEAADVASSSQLARNNMNTNVCNTVSNTCDAEESHSSLKPYHSAPYGCVEPSCTYSCGIGSQTPHSLGNKQLRSQEGRSSVSCDEEICREVAWTVAPTFHHWTVPAPLECSSGSVGSSVGKYVSVESFKLYPIGFVSPPSDIVSCVPEKVYDFSAIDPANRNSYIYGMRDQSEYKRNMAHSRFSYTRKKAGWDAQRHFEIMASGAIPYFEAIESIPERIIPFMPKEILTAAKNFADSYASTIDNLSRPTEFKSNFNHSMYNEIACCVLSHAKEHQTSVALVRYLLKVAKNHDYSIDNLKNVVVRNVLVLCGPPEFDYMVSSLLHGLREILGDSAVTDYPPNPLYYEIQSDVFSSYTTLSSTYVHGLGYTWSHRLRNNTRLRESFNRADIRKGIIEKRWDLVIYPQVHRGMPYWDLVKSSYDRGKIVLIDAEDWSSGQNLMVEYLHHQGENGKPLRWPPLNSDWRALFHQGIYFKRELDSCPDNSDQYFIKFGIR